MDMLEGLCGRRQLCNLIRDRLAGTSAGLPFYSIDQPAVDRRQEGSVEDIGRGRPLLELEVLRDLADRTLEPGGINGADAVMLDLRGQNVVADDDAESLEFEVARSAVHPADHLVHRAAWLLDGEVPAADHRAHEDLHRLGLWLDEGRIDALCESIVVS